MREFELLMSEHKVLLNKFRDAANEIKQIQFETDDDILLLEQIIEYRNKLQKKIVSLYKQIEIEKLEQTLDQTKVKILFSENDDIVSDIMKIDSENLIFLTKHKDKIKQELLGLTIKKKAISSYKMKQINLPKFTNKA